MIHRLCGRSGGRLNSFAISFFLGEKKKTWLSVIKAHISSLHMLWHAGCCIRICAVRECVQAAIIQDESPRWPHWHILCERCCKAGFAFFFFFVMQLSLTYSSFHLSLEPVVLFCLSDQIALHRTSAAAGLFISSHLNLNFVSPFQLHLPFALWLAFHFWLHFCLWLRLFLNVVIVCEWACNAVPGHSEHLGQH